MQQKIKIFKALGNETRFLIFKNVFTGGYACSLDGVKHETQSTYHAMCVSTIAEQFDFSLPTISKHLQLLKDANIIKMQKRANKIYIEPNLEIVSELGDCFADLAKERR